MFMTVWRTGRFTSVFYRNLSHGVTPSFKAATIIAHFSGSLFVTFLLATGFEVFHNIFLAFTPTDIILLFKVVSYPIHCPEHACLIHISMVINLSTLYCSRLKEF